MSDSHVIAAGMQPIAGLRLKMSSLSKMGHIAHMCRNRNKTMRMQYVEQEQGQEDDVYHSEHELFSVYRVYTAMDGNDAILPHITSPTA